MKHGATIILRAVIYLIGAIILAICIFALPRAIAAEFKGDFDYGYIFIIMYLSVLPFFFALYQALRLLKNIGDNQPFTNLSVDLLRKIKLSVFSISLIYALSMPYIFYVGDRDDAPGVVAIGFIIVFTSFVVATVAALLQNSFQDAIDIISER